MLVDLEKRKESESRLILSQIPDSDKLRRQKYSQSWLMAEMALYLSPKCRVGSILCQKWHSSSARFLCLSNHLWKIELLAIWREHGELRGSHQELK